MWKRLPMFCKSLRTRSFGTGASPKYGSSVNSKRRASMQADRWKRVEELFEGAMAQPQEKRAAFLEQACPDDPELRREVESLLNLVPSAAAFLEGAPISSMHERSLVLTRGQMLGNFEILEPVGRGGMGEVYGAKDARLDRVVAIKVLPQHHYNDPQARKRFEREARAISALSHPHICALYDIGHQDGIDYLVMEYLEGETLANRLKKGPLPLEQ